MTSFTISLPGDISITVSCEESDIREVVSEILMGLKDYADECNDQKKKNERPKKGGDFSVGCAGRTVMHPILDQLCNDIDRYGEVTIADLKRYANVTPIYIQDRHLGVNRKRDIIGSTTDDGYKITMKNLIEVY